MSEALERWSKLYLRVTSLIFFTTGVVKIISLVGTAPILSMVDPVWGIQMRFLLAVAGFWELSMSIFLWLNPRIRICHILTLWTGSVFVAYRTALYLLGEDHVCPCLGTMTNWLVWLSPAAKDNMLRAAIAWFIGGSLLFSILHCLSGNHVRHDLNRTVTG